MAAELGIDRSYLSQLEGGKRPIKDWVMEQIEILEHAPVNNPVNKRSNQASLYLKPIRNVPILSWAQAGALKAYEELPASWHEMTATTCQDENCFAVEIEGDSMEPKYSPGDLAIVMPNVTPRNGCLVVSRLLDDGVYFKLFHQTPDAKRVRLTSYNSLYPVMEMELKDIQWIYPVHSITKNVWR